MKTIHTRTPRIGKDGHIFSITSFLYSIGLGALLPIFPNFVESIIHHEAYVGFFYSVISISMIIAGLTSSYFFHKFSKIKMLYVSMIVTALTTMFFVFAGQFYQLLSFELIRVFAALLMGMTVALMVHDFTAAKNLGKTEGAYFRASNCGWFIGPVLGGVIAKYCGYEPVFVLSGVFVFIALLFVTHHHLVKKHPSLSVPHVPSKRVSKTNKFKLFVSNRKRVGAYIVSLVLIFWLSFKAIVIPLFVVDMGYSSEISGIIMSLAIVPFILLEAPVGKYGDTHELKKPIMFGFFIIAFLVMAVKISPFFLLDAALLILANIGAAFIEPLHDVYFFRNVSKDEEDDLFGVFITADPIAKFIAPAIVSTSLILLPFEWVFVVFGGVFLLTGILCYYLVQG